MSASLVAQLGCGGSAQQAGQRAPNKLPVNAPSWVAHVDLDDDKICGVGVAGPAFDESSPYPQRLSEQRAVRNLAGALETNIQEAIIDRSTNRLTTIDTARVVTVDEALIEWVAQVAKTEFWLDEHGAGPFAQKGFTYAHTCIEAAVAADRLHIDLDAVRGKGSRQAITPARIPGWIGSTGKQPGGRLCAVGFSLPTFFPDKTFAVVNEDVRCQLAEVLKTLVSSYYEELTTNNYQLFEMMTVATTDSVSKGALVTDYWYDRDGIGPHGHKRTTYGWGCVYPVQVIKKSIEAVEKELPENVVAKVRERAENAFAELDAEVEKRDGSAAQDESERPSEQPSPESLPSTGDAAAPLDNSASGMKKMARDPERM